MADGRMATGEPPWRAGLIPYLEDNATTWTAIEHSLPDGLAVDHDTFVIFGLLEAAGRGWTLVHRRVLEGFGLNHSEWTTISMLRTSPPDFRRSPTELRHLVGQTSAGMARILDKLEYARLVTREARPEDRRGLDVALTPAGHRTAEASFRALHGAQGEVIASLSSAERATAIGALDRLLQALGAQGPPPGEARDVDRPTMPTTSTSGGVR
jgi:DNA-binding MarR family transcriptional regulator